MQSGTSLKTRLKALLDVIESEATRNSAFAAQLAAVFGSALPEHVTRIGPPSGRNRPIPIPDVFTALQEKGDEEFRFWLRTLDLPTLKATVKQNGFDPAKASQRWKDTDKFIALVHEQTQARLKRGSAFLPPKAQSPTPDGGKGPAG
jgi:hypothetical protein